ncbi:MAG: hypothetical protein H7257_04635 [Taibaiella sp.]|nr:hypothetical protein [Taibaiella sp.]
MRIQSLLTIAIPALLAGTARAQDRIFQTNGNVIKAKVSSVTADNVTYKAWSNLDGPDYTIERSEVDKIKYEGGREERFSNNERHGLPPGLRHWRNHEHKTMNMGSTIFSFAPIAATESGVGFALSFEKGIDEGGIVAFTLPLILSLNINNFDGYNNYNGGYGENRNDFMTYICPGLKFYPTSSKGKVKYAIGPSLVLGAGQETSYNYYQYSSSYFGTYDKLLMGVTINNSLNINPTKHFYMGVEMAFGFTYVNMLNQVNQGMGGISQFSFKLGYRL